jgi:hypothetical protein
LLELKKMHPGWSRDVWKGLTEVIRRFWCEQGKRVDTGLGSAEKDIGIRNRGKEKQGLNEDVLLYSYHIQDVYGTFKQRCIASSWVCGLGGREEKFSVLNRTSERGIAEITGNPKYINACIDQKDPSLMLQALLHNCICVGKDTGLNMEDFF